MSVLVFLYYLFIFVSRVQSFVAEAMLIMATVLHLGKSSLPKKPITDDDVERISLCLKVLAESSPLMSDIFNKECRKSLSHMLTVRLEEEKLSQKVYTRAHSFWFIMTLYASLKFYFISSYFYFSKVFLCIWYGVGKVFVFSDFCPSH